MNISGQNVLFGRQRTEYSYYFSRFTLCWGWATWKRSWQYFDIDLKLWPKIRDKRFMTDILEDPYAVKVWQRTAQMLYDGQLTGWDFKWMFACWLQNGLCIIPNGNLVTNIGYGLEATHIHNENDPYIKMATEAMNFPLKQPPFVIRDLEADKFTQRTLFDYDPNILKKVQKKMKKLLKI
jgi:hypothetical protein